MIFGARVPHRELAAAAPPAEKPGQQSVAMPGSPVMPARGTLSLTILRIASVLSLTAIAFMAVQVSASHSSRVLRRYLLEWRMPNPGATRLLP